MRIACSSGFFIAKYDPSKKGYFMSKSIQLFILLGILILIWGFSWPIMSIGLKYCPPIWYSAIRLSMATVFVFIVMGFSRKLILPAKKDFPLIFSIGLFQVGLFVLLITTGLQYVAPGRSAIIAYTSPLFVTPIAVLFFHEKLTKIKLAGLILGVIGVATLFSPWELNWHDKNIIFGNTLLLGAALIWSFVMIHTRYAKWHRPSHLLLPWQMLIGTLPNILMAFYLEPHPQINMTLSLEWSLFYAGILSSVIAYWILIVITRSLPVITTSLLLLGVPMLGLLSSALIIGEKLTFNIIISFIFILSGLVFVSISPFFDNMAHPEN
jgi:drug/metabolite transporter (DMT)-like permease